MGTLNLKKKKLVGASGRLSNTPEPKRHTAGSQQGLKAYIPQQHQVSLLLPPRAGRSAMVLGSTQGPRETQAVFPLEEGTTLNFI